MLDQKYIIVDVDGTISNCEHRINFAKTQDWDEFHSRCDCDEQIKENLDVVAGLADTFEIILVTGRPEKYRQQTETWLKDQMVYHLITDVLMRPKDDYSPDGVMKEGLITEYFGSLSTALEKVTVILDDRDKVVDHFRGLGFNVWQVAESGY